MALGGSLALGYRTPTVERADFDAPSSLDSPGGERAGRYELFAEIGSGGMARVHVGRLLGAAGFARTVAIKRPLPALTRDEDFRRAAGNEARLAARVHHPNVVPTLDVVEHGDELLIVMEYVHGESLAALASASRERGARVPFPIASALVVGALRGLEAVHAARDERGRPIGLIHRDVSPQNILVGVDGLPRLSDFGLAKAAGQANFTGKDEFKGKLTYASPEQVSLDALTPATDLYSMGLVLWELLAGERLYTGMTSAEVVARLLAGGAVPAPSRSAAGVPASLDAVVERATRRRPDQRFASAAAMAEALERSVKPAVPAEVAAWVRALSSRSLAERERLVMVAERQTTASKRAGALLGATLNGPSSFELAVTMPFGPLVGAANGLHSGAALTADGHHTTLASPGQASAGPRQALARAQTLTSAPPPGAVVEGVSRATNAPLPRSSFAAIALRVSGVLVGAALALGVANVVAPRKVASTSSAPTISPSLDPPPDASAVVTGQPSAEAPPPSPPGTVAGEIAAPPATSPGARESLGARGRQSPAGSAPHPMPSRKKTMPEPRPAGERPEPRHEGERPEPRRDNCSPPYSIDADGIRHMKPGCQ